MRDFHYTVNVLVKAYLNDTLVHGNCCACAVGNIIAAAHGWGYQTENECGLDTLRWDSGFSYNWYSGLHERTVLETWQTNGTGYSAKELSLIENAFETSGREASRNNQTDVMFISLMAVVDVLADIHGIDLTTREETKKLFVKS